jgi:hypothetical protein
MHDSVVFGPVTIVSVAGGPMLDAMLDFHSNHGHPQSAGLHLPEGACFMSTMRVYTREFRESAVGMVLSLGLSIRVCTQCGLPRF